MIKLKLKIPKDFYKEEERCGYVVTKQMKEIWAIELDLMSEFMKVCNKHQIRYYADSGTVLGAVRHKGFIPWDNDIDIAMSRADYEKLCQIANKEFVYPYFFQTEDTDPGSFRGHAQLRNSETTAILSSDKNKKLKFNQGIFIDVFPLDNIPDEKIKKMMFSYKITLLNKIEKNLLSLYRYKNTSSTNNIIAACKTVLNKTFLFVDEQLHLLNKIYSYLEKCKTKHSKSKTEKCGNLYNPNLNYFKKRLRKSSYVNLEPVYTKFEILNIPIPREYDDYLRYMYGDYNKYVINEGYHGSIVFDTKESYKKYI